MTVWEFRESLFLIRIIMLSLIVHARVLPRLHGLFKKASQYAKGCVDAKDKKVQTRV